MKRNKRQVPKATLLGFLTAVIIGLLAAVFWGTAVYLFDLPEGVTRIIALVCYLMAVFSGGYVATVLAKGRGIYPVERIAILTLGFGLALFWWGYNYSAFNWVRLALRIPLTFIALFLGSRMAVRRKRKYTRVDWRAADRYNSSL
jgi:hypothetical protein